MTKKFLMILWAIISILVVAGGFGNAFTSFRDTTFFYCCIGIGVMGIISLIIEIIVLLASLDLKKRKQVKSTTKMINGYMQLQIGMSKTEVLNLLGSPTGCRTQNGMETFTWKHSEFKGLVRGGTIVRTIIVDFVDDKVTGYDSENMDRSRF